MSARFEVFKNPSGSKTYPYVLVLQHELLEPLPTRLVVPLARKDELGAPAITRLNPQFVIERIPVVMLTQQLGAVPTARLQKRVGSLEARSAEILAAVDVLVSGL